MLKLQRTVMGTVLDYSIGSIAPTLCKWSHEPPRPCQLPGLRQAHGFLPFTYGKLPYHTQKMNSFKAMPI